MSEITTKNGLLWRDGEMICLPEADKVAREHGYIHAEELVKALENEAKILTKTDTELMDWLEEYSGSWFGVGYTGGVEKVRLDWEGEDTDGNLSEHSVEADTMREAIIMAMEVGNEDKSGEEDKQGPESISRLSDSEG